MKRSFLALLIVIISGSLARADIQHLDDVIIGFSLCVGNDCVNGENFGFDTIRLKENNLRIHFDDTSNSASFPRNDWRIIINDTSNGGDSYFAIEDSTAGRQVFRVEAGAPSNSLYVDDGGRVGFGTSTPVVELHVKDGDTPTLRLEQDGSSGFTAQTWDVAGNETNFFVRDVTNSSKLPFRIRPSAPSNSIYVDTNGDVGMNTSSPDASLHVLRTDGTAQVLVEDASGTTAQRNLLQLSNNGAARMGFEDTSTTDLWRIGLRSNGTFQVLYANTAVRVIEAMQNGNVEIAGDVTANSVLLTSDIDAKENITPVDGQLVLAKLGNVPISTWNFKKDESQARHLGPMAQDFHKAFGLGPDERHVAPLDVASVALAAVKELDQKAQTKDARIAELEARLAALEALLSKTNDAK